MSKTLRCNYRAHDVWAHKSQLPIKKLFVYKHKLSAINWVRPVNSYLLIWSNMMSATSSINSLVKHWHFFIVTHRSFTNYSTNQLFLNSYFYSKTNLSRVKHTLANPTNILRLL